MLVKPIILTMLLVLAAPFTCLQAADDAYAEIVALGPVGFWPADEGQGKRLRNLGSMEREALLFNTGWANGAIDFNAAFQFVEIPRHPATLNTSFSLGAWVFVRQPRSGRVSDSRGTMLLGNWGRHWRKMPGPIMLKLTGEEKRTVEVVSNRQGDVVGSKASGIRIEPETWQHIFYTYSDGVGTLYLNGEAVASARDIPYTPQEGEYMAGADANWWALYPPRPEALDGSLAGIAIFDRALEAPEVATLTATKPDTQPHTLAADELRLHGQFIQLGELASQPLEEQRLAIRHMHRPRYGWVGSAEANAEVLTPYLAQALRHPLLRVDAALLLHKMNDQATLLAAKDDLLATVADTDAADADRATAAQVLGRLGAAARDVTGMLVTLLDEEVDEPRVPKVEEGFRNALIQALLTIDPDNAEVRQVLGRVYAKPILDYLDLDNDKVRNLVAQGRFMDALDASKPLIREQQLYFRSQGDPARDQRTPWSGNDRAYTPVDKFNGYTYIFGNAKAFDGAEPITKDVYDRALAAYASDFPEAATWMDGKWDNLFRADLKRTAPDGTVETVYIGGETFIFSGRDAKTKGWSVAIDRKGYIHVMGGQHNYPRYSEYMPGAWQSLGISPDRRDPNGPTTLYWISKRPEDISEFEFVGRKDHPQDIPVPYMNYMNFVQDRNDELYLYGRNDSGIQNWALYRYDVEERRWHDLGGERVEVFTSARQAAPNWVETVEYVHVYCFRGAIPTPRVANEHGREYPSLCWAWQPFFYNYIRSTRGVQWDPDNRLYIEIPILGYDGRHRISESDQFAYSDDGGQTYFRADGSPVQLPLTNNPAPNHNADLLSGYNQLYHDIWLDLITRNGFTF